MEIQKEMAARVEMIEAALKQYLPLEQDYPPVIHAAMHYSVMAGGKRLRPMLTLAATEVVGGEPSRALPVACGIEMIHTYSLIHDDLPCMDNDDWRRGKPTSHKVFGEGMAVLAGDALLTYAVELMLREGMAVGNDPVRLVQVVTEIMDAVGTKGMIGGQVVDLECEGQQIDLATLQYIHRHKTGALLRAAVRSGAILGGATPNVLTALTVYAEEVGLAFQIVDDLLDLTGEEAKLGKPVGSDLRNGKATFPAFYGVAESRKLASAAIQRAIAALEIFGVEAAFLRSLALYVTAREC